LTILISFCALLTALFSLFISGEKLSLDLYNRRFDIYVRTIRFYHALLKYNGGIEDGTFATLRADFILASREAKFLFGPKSGVYDLLSRLDKESFKITGRRSVPMGLPLEQESEFNKEFFDARTLWNTKIEPLEDLMAPYLNYHYASTLSALVGRTRKWWGTLRE
jgi:hypothetical protein